MSKRPRRGTDGLTRRDALAAGLGGLVAGVGGLAGCLEARAAPAFVRRRAPNVLFIVTDQERAPDRLPNDTHTPARDRLAERAVTFERAHVVSALCSTSRGTLYTGAHGQHTGLFENTPLPWARGLSADVPTLGTHFRDAGYRTGYFGKWHLTHLDHTRPHPASELAALFARYGFDFSDQRWEGDGAQAGHHLDPHTATTAARFVHEGAASRTPWLAAVNFVNPHDVMLYMTGDEQRDSRTAQLPDRILPAPDDPRYAKRRALSLPDTFGPLEALEAPAAVRRQARNDEILLGTIDRDRPELWLDFANYYANCVEDVDRHIGTVLDALDESGQREETIVVLVSDHGEMLGDHGMRGKGCHVYDEANRVPLQIAHPDVAGGDRCAAITSHVDLLPTLLALAGITPREPRPRAGIDFSELLAHPGRTGPRDTSGALLQWSSLLAIDPEVSRTMLRLAATPDPFEKLSIALRERLLMDLERRGFMRGMVTERYKFARYFAPSDHHRPRDAETLRARNDLELYDLRDDPSETHNLARNFDAHSGTIMELAARLDALVEREVGVDDGGHMPGPALLWSDA